MLDVPLAKAVIVANSPIYGKKPAVAVFPKRDARGNTYDVVFGACESRWSEHHDHRLGFLYEIMWHLAHVYQIPTDVIHAALQCIPEYRNLDGNDLRYSVT